jgi:twinkle protein
MNVGEISQRLASQAEDVCQLLLPNGERKGPEWKVGSKDGEAGQSLSVRLTGNKAGVWADFQSGEGGDLIDLWCATKGLSLAEAVTEAKDYLGIRDERPKREEKTSKRPAKPECKVPKGRVRDWLATRGIEDRTIAAFKVGEQVRDGKVYAVFPYLRDGELVNVKYRNADEKKDMRQEGGAEPCLFGWHLIEPRTRTVAITEGEIDAMTLWQAGIPALSVNAGAGNHQWLESDWDRLDRFSEILVAFDDDEAGEKGAKEVIARLGPMRCKRLKFPAKDANQWLMDGACGEDFTNAVQDCKPDDPPELRQLADFMGKVKAIFYPDGSAIKEPVLRLDKDLDFFEFRPGELTVWTGYNGHGKSLVLSQVELGLVQQGQKFCIFSGELSGERQLKRASKQAAGLDRPTKAYLDAIEEWIRDRMWVFNIHGTAGLDRLLEVFDYAHKRYGVRQFVIDSLMMTDVPEDGPGAITEQKKAIQKICGFVRPIGGHLHLVAHPRKGRDESSAPGKMDVAGAGKITDGADNVFTVWAALRDESEAATDEPDGRLELVKQRNGDVQHRSVALWFNKATQQFATNGRRHPVRYVDFTGAPQEATQ